MDPILLKKYEYNDIINNKKCIGSGVDGSVYRINRNTVYKFYHKQNTFIDLPNANIDEEGVIVSDFKNLRPYNRVVRNESIYYTDKDGVILTREDAIIKAIAKQENVKLTDLPRNVIYLNNKIIGCEYKYYPCKLGIYAATYLPLKQRLIVCKRLMEEVKELLNNNIYPVTLAQRDEVFPFIKNKSNILIGRDLKPVIIDLDGISALYSDNYSKKYYDKVMASLSSLILELLTKVELANNIEDDENVINDYIGSLYEKGIPIHLARKFFDNYRLEINELDDIIKTLELTKK